MTHDEERRLEILVGNLLRAGVLLAAAVVVAGAIPFLLRHGLEPAGHHVFRGEPPQFRSVGLILRDAASLSSTGIIQLGLLLLIATPVARVAFSALAFARLRDRLYVAITLVVLALLLYSLFGAA
jgi:uncharacterized membrane protein